VYNPSEELEVEVNRYSLSELERNTLAHFPGVVSAELLQAFRGAVMLFEQILSQMWLLGLRVRISPLALRLTDLPEFESSKGSEIDTANGVYDIPRKLIGVREQTLLDYTNRHGYGTFIHEVAHFIWFELLSATERGYVEHLFKREKTERSRSRAYRLRDEFEFFADGFMYYVTPHRHEEILIPAHNWDENRDEASEATLKLLNLGLYTFLHKKFQGLIHPDLLTPQFFPEKTLSYERWEENGLYLQIIVLPGVIDY
jgi:hypothetical protein